MPAARGASPRAIESLRSLASLGVRVRCHHHARPAPRVLYRLEQSRDPRVVVVFRLVRGT